MNGQMLTGSLSLTLSQAIPSVPASVSHCPRLSPQSQSVPRTPVPHTAQLLTRPSGPPHHGHCVCYDNHPGRTHSTTDSVKLRLAFP